MTIYDPFDPRTHGAAQAQAVDKPRRINDAFVHGNHAREVLQRRIALSIGASARATDWSTWSGTYEDFLAKATKFQTGAKDGQAFLQGCLADGAPTRSKKTVRELHVLMLDMETGQPVREVAEAIKALGLAAFVYSTHSHMTRTSEISLEDWERWRKADGRKGEATAADAADYLVDVKKVRREILRDLQLGNLSANGTKRIVSHEPMPRCRVCLLLSEPFNITDPEADNQRWKGLVRGVAAMLGFVVDPSAIEIARLMYTPRHAGTDHARQHQEMHAIAGKMLDLSTVKPASAVDEKARKVDSDSKSGTGEPKKAATGHQFATRNFRRFLKIAGASFRAADWLKETDTENLRHTYDGVGKIDYRCPREAAHTTGDNTDRAFAVWNGDGTKGFGMSCMHAGCKAYVTRDDGKEDRGIYLDLLCQQHGIEDAGELLLWCSAEAQAEWNQRPLLFIPDHMGSARRFIQACRTVDGTPTLRRYRGEWYGWDGRCYVRLANEAIDGEVRRFLDGCDKLNKDEDRVPVNPNNELVGNVLNALKALPGIAVPDAAETPIWLAEQMAPRPAARDVLACANGLLDLNTREVLPHSASFFSLHCLPYAYDPKAPSPVTFLRCLDEWFADFDSKVCLQVWFALNLKGDTKHHKAIYIQGPRRSGKSKLVKVLAAMLGQNNVATPLLDSFGERFGLEDMIGKRAAIVADARLGDHAQPKKIVARLLTLIADDAMRIDRKHLPALSNVQMGMLVTMCSNDPLHVEDPSGAFASRFVMLQTARSFLGEEDKELEGKLMAELPGILNWALRGIMIEDILGLVQPEASAGVMREMEDASAPLAAFVRDHCTVGPHEAVPRQDMLEAYNGFAQARGYPTYTSITFGRALHSVVQVTRGGSNDARTYRGLSLKRSASAWLDKFNLAR